MASNKKTRSEIMASVRSKNTSIEVMVRKNLYSEGFRYRKNVKALPGTPDIVLPKYKTVIFVNGCFWHGHLNCKNFRMPNSRLEYWQPKIEKNISRDKANYSSLKDLGWNIIVIWECELKQNPMKCFSELSIQIRNNLKKEEIK